LLRVGFRFQAATIMLRYLTAAVLVGSASASLKELDDKTWGPATEGKNCFVMFQAPW